MRIGIIPDMIGSGGGVYQYSLTMLRALHDWKSDGCEDEFIVFADNAHHAALMRFNGRNWTVNPMQCPSLHKQALDILRCIIGEGPHREAWRWLRGQLPGKGILPNADVVQYRPEASRWLNNSGVDLMIYPNPTSLSFETGVPYIMAVHDLQHRLQPEFPEVSANGEWERREYLFRNAIRNATLILADSEVGKEDILNFYGSCGITPDRVKVLPFLPACYLGIHISEGERQRVRKIYHLPERYLFYPAQLWPHKNHTRIIRALGLLKREHSLRIPAVFCGSHSGEIRKRTFHEAMSVSSQLGLEEEIHYLGYLPDGDMSAIYADAVALVMPTFFGPTNIPVLEAWAFGCPVLTSDIRGIREQVENAAILVDPRSVEAIADGIYRLWTDENLRCTLAALGRQRLGRYTPEDYGQRLVAILEEAKTRVCGQKSESNKIPA
jgi:glycosyltransferase involved in cell wall biosynthesis